jgi:16S rRNA (adenine1518-N6/adenine1519-N6)-dimethyltransferase
LTESALPPLIDIIRRHGLEPRKSLGQNFLLDQRLTGRIARATGDLDSINVVEIGPGPGGLTRALLEAGAAKIVAIERDTRCLAALDELARCYPGRLEIVAGDALTIDAASLVPPPRRIIANLPYNIATPLLIAWLRQAGAWQALGLMFQKEVAQRLAARPGGKEYGRLSVLTQWLMQVSLAFDIPPGAFMPPPKIVSTFVIFRPRPAPLAPADFAALERVTAAGFGQRRKMLRSSLKSLGLDPLALCGAAGIDPSLRAEQLDIEQFCAIAQLLPRSNALQS